MFGFWHGNHAVAGTFQNSALRGTNLALQEIDIPDSIRQDSQNPAAEALIDQANGAIEAFMLRDQEVIENFVTCDFALADHALQWILENHLSTGQRFCELGSGFGVVTLLASLAGMEAIGIEIEQVLVDECIDLSERLAIEAEFYCGSFIPRNSLEGIEFDRDIKNVSTEEGDVYREVGLSMSDFDLFFAFPWPGEHVFFEQVFDEWAAVGSLLLTYRGRDGMHLIRKV